MSVLVRTVSFRSYELEPIRRKYSSTSDELFGVFTMSFISVGLGSSAASGYRPSEMDRASLENAVRTIISDRHRRAQCLGDDLFFDPAWDILLALTLAEARFHRLSVSGLCKRLNVPATTVLRWIAKLADKGLICRREDLHDKRRTYIELSEAGREAMAAYCSSNSVKLAAAA